MNNRKYNWILYLISLTIVTTIAVQLYWNYKNYKQNKQYIINEIQKSFDSSIEEYFAKLTKESLYTIVQPKKKKKNYLPKSFNLDSVLKSVTQNSKSTKDNLSFQISSLEIATDNSGELKKMDSIFFNSLLDDVHANLGKKKHLESSTKDSKEEQLIIKEKANDIFLTDPLETEDIKIFSGKKANDSLNLIKGLQTIFITVKNDTLNHSKVDSILSRSLSKKGISSSFYLHHIKNDSLFFDSKKNEQPNYKLSADAKSTYLQLDEKLTVFYSNPTIEILKRSSIGILLSSILSLAVIASLFYMLKVINKQKELAEIKNDLISNITHEFKTPITTVSTAIEAIDNFNIINDKEKTKKYLSISSVQLKKLHQMVEKLLETATLDSEKLLLKKEEVDIVELIEKNTTKHQLISKNKTITFSSSVSTCFMKIDLFHFENAISNLIDNAVKYGGDVIEININKVLDSIEIAIADNGKGIEKNQQEKIFDKFYRVPKGNTHDVKGFGIGLFYTKKIIEKHHGNIALSSNTKHTIFKINIPND
ncbi:two-component system, OmpR family, phosphate regulon sensor histidine kinase PhoR [Tenacibaculum sp. MAR_2009_124]|uniref:sensor histidine kinase n=1 Tax=Tenacibaculum sp. MAR_2009_124 TaxID=1250059 RepID=UPI00089944E5|nr:HAMP domain-containing sensor histidine kinase [Tenacibaculum sp. MAR_2009_124]SED13450.1 two-component system, OmpR family, phosphate regulon sensor histidine kinase PhoR [Tenacibaculum sp. MAR_2009_124]